MTVPFISINVQDIQKQTEAVCRKLDATIEEILATTKIAMVEVSNDLVSEAQSRINNRSGDLSRTGTVEEVVVQDTRLINRFGFNSKHGMQTDKGGPIVARNGKNLAIPLDPILTARGVPKYPSPRAEPGLFLLKLWGKLFLAKKMGPTDESIELHWLLTPRVEQPGTKFLTTTVEENAQDIPRRIADRVAQRLGGAE